MNTATGEKLKADALATLEAARETVILRARRALVLRLLVNGAATLDDVRANIDLGAANPSALGAVPGSLARANIIRCAGYRPAARPAARARIVTLWALADRGRAIAWLQEHPAPEPVATRGGQLALPLGGG